MRDLHDHAGAVGGLTSDPAPTESLTARQRAAFAEAGTTLLNASLSHLDAGDQAAFWSAVRLAYNRPYNAAAPLRDEPVRLPALDAGLAPPPDLGLPMV